jgi:hypothetical protein
MALRSVTKYFGFSIETPPGKGWVRLLAEEPKRRGIAGVVLGRDKELVNWAVEAAHELLGPEPDPDLLAKHAELLTDLTLGCRERGVIRAYAWIPDGMAAAAAKVDISMVRTSRERPVLTLDMLENSYAGRDDKTRTLEVSRTEVPAGPAIRLRREWGEGDDPSDIAVSVTYVIRPPAIRNALVYMMYWVLVDDFPALTEIADSLVRTLRVTTDV